MLWHLYFLMLQLQRWHTQQTMLSSLTNETDCSHCHKLYTLLALKAEMYALLAYHCTVTCKLEHDETSSAGFCHNSHCTHKWDLEELIHH